MWREDAMKAVITLLKGLFLVVVIIGTFVMNCIGAIICAITE